VTDVAESDRLPARYRVLPESIEFKIPGFESQYRPGHLVQAPSRLDCRDWFHAFVGRLIAACGVRYLPVVRIGDGELRFLLGEQRPDVRVPLRARARQCTGRLSRWLLGRDFVAATPGHYVSGRYTRREWHSAREAYDLHLRAIGQSGIMALPLHYGEEPFYERYYPGLRRWLEHSGIALTAENYVPVYFPYAALTGSRRGELLRGRRILVVNGASGTRREKIEEGLVREGVARVAWLTISAERSVYDSLDVTRMVGQVDLALVGAGIGKPNILHQLEPLQIPCIDAGFVFEVWADPRHGAERPFCAPDELTT
jgi:hypothetical protein